MSVAAPARGVQTPRIQWVPPYVRTSGDDVIELAAMAGLHLDPWEQLVLRESLGEREDGRWSAFEVGVVVARQNGKGAILEARELGGLYVLGERLIIHSAHQFDTSLEAFRRLLALIEDTPDLDREVMRVSRAHGEEGIELRSRQRIRFRTRTKGGGRGFSGDCVILDEAMDLPDTAHSALLPTVSARPNPQVWYTGSAVDKEVHEHGVVLARVRERGLKGDPRLAYFEWSVDPDVYKVDPLGVAVDEDAWAQANPGLGIRIMPETVANEQRSMRAKSFAVERLSVGDWPATDDTAERVIPVTAWAACFEGVDQSLADPVAFAVEMSTDRKRCAIVAAGARKGDGRPLVDVVIFQPGSGWVVDKLVDLQEHKPCAVVVDPAGPAGSLLTELEEAGVEVVTPTARDVAQACGQFYDAVVDPDGAEQAPPKLLHLDQEPLNLALAAARWRPLGDARAWSRKDSTDDISALYAATLALWGWATHRGTTYDVLQSVW